MPSSPTSTSCRRWPASSGRRRPIPTGRARTTPPSSSIPMPPRCRTTRSLPTTTGRPGRRRALRLRRQPHRQRPRRALHPGQVLRPAWRRRRAVGDVRPQARPAGGAQHRLARLHTDPNARAGAGALEGEAGRGGATRCGRWTESGVRSQESKTAGAAWSRRPGRSLCKGVLFTMRRSPGSDTMEHSVAERVPMAWGHVWTADAMGHALRAGTPAISAREDDSPALPRAG